MVSFHLCGGLISPRLGKNGNASVHDLAAKKPQRKKNKVTVWITIIQQNTENETIINSIAIILFILIELEYYRTSDCHDPPKHPLPVTIPLRLISAASVCDDDENINRLIFSFWFYRGIVLVLTR